MTFPNLSIASRGILTIPVAALIKREVSPNEMKVNKTKPPQNYMIQERLFNLALSSIENKLYENSGYNNIFSDFTEKDKK